MKPNRTTLSVPGHRNHMQSIALESSAVDGKIFDQPYLVVLYWNNRNDIRVD